VGLH